MFQLEAPEPNYKEPKKKQLSDFLGQIPNDDETWSKLGRHPEEQIRTFASLTRITTGACVPLPPPGDHTDILQVLDDYSGFSIGLSRYKPLFRYSTLIFFCVSAVSLKLGASLEDVTAKTKRFLVDVQGSCKGGRCIHIATSRCRGVGSPKDR